MSEVKMPSKDDIYQSQSDKVRESSSLIPQSSLKEKSTLQESQTRQHEKRIEAVTDQAIVRPRKRSKLKEAFFGTDVDNLKDHLIYKVFIPALKATIEDMFGQGLHMALFGETKKVSNSSAARRMAYGSMYNIGSRVERNFDTRERDTFRDYNDLLFPSEKIASTVVEDLFKYANQYEGYASILDLYDAAGVSAGSHIDDDFGWSEREIMMAKIKRVYDHGDILYTIDLPRPHPIR